MTAPEPPSTTLARSLAAIDEANAGDPNLIDDGGELRPKELVHAERMTAWLAMLAPDADDAQLLAARAHHFRRWESPRSDYPAGRPGYLRWRRDARARHAADVDALLAGCGVDEQVRADCARIIAKEGVGGRTGPTDGRVQTHEDALCLVFFELQAAETAASLGDRAVDVVRKTLAKMSPAGRRHLRDARLDPAVRDLLDELGGLDEPDDVTA